MCIVFKCFNMWHRQHHNLCNLSLTKQLYQLDILQGKFLCRQTLLQYTECKSWHFCNLYKVIRNSHIHLIVQKFRPGKIHCIDCWSEKDSRCILCNFGLKCKQRSYFHTLNILYYQNLDKTLMDKQSSTYYPGKDRLHYRSRSYPVEWHKFCKMIYKVNKFFRPLRKCLVYRIRHIKNLALVSLYYQDPNYKQCIQFLMYKQNMAIRREYINFLLQHLVQKNTDLHTFQYSSYRTILDKKQDRIQNINFFGLHIPSTNHHISRKQLQKANAIVDYMLLHIHCLVKAFHSKQRCKMYIHLVLHLSKCKLDMDSCNSLQL